MLRTSCQLHTLDLMIIIEGSASRDPYIISENSRNAALSMRENWLCISALAYSHTLA